MVVGDTIHWQQREAWIYSKEVYTRYPFQAATYRVPPEVIKECVLGAITACYETGADTVQNFHAFIFRNWGEGVATHFRSPSNQKLLAMPPEEGHVLEFLEKEGSRRETLRG